MKKIRTIVQKESTFIILLVFAVVMSVLHRNFLTSSNILNIIRQSSTNGLIAFGMTLVILTAGIDLSVGSILAFTAACTALLLQTNLPAMVVLVVSLVLGLLLGASNGVIVAYGKVQPFIATLSTMTIFRGLTLVLTNGRPISIANSSTLVEAIGTGYGIKIPIPVYVLFIVFLLLWFTLTKTTIGKYIYALGGNEKASYIAGIKNNIIKIYVYSVSGVLSTLAGFILLSRLSSAQPNLGVGYELDAIAAVVIGGTPLSGGRGRISGTLFGAIIIGMLNNSLNLMGVSSFYQQVVKGIVILFAVLFDMKK